MIDFLNLNKVNSQYSDEIQSAVNRVLNSGWYLQGAEVDRFEKHYANFIGTKHCVTCASGLDALTLIFRAYIELGVMQPGDEVIVPANTFIATILSITENGLVPILCEPKINTLEIDDDRIEPLITSKTKAIAIVHLYGRNAYTSKIQDICNRNNLLLIEDNAQSHGCKHTDGRCTGSLGNIAAHSFYPGKNLGALGDGGAITTDNNQLAEVIRSLANYGSSKKYVFKYQGRNSRLDEIQAAILDVKLHHLINDNTRRQQVAHYYYDNISNPLITLPDLLPDAQNVYHLFPVFTPRRDELQSHLAKHDIQSLIHYPIPPHKQECYKEWNTLSLPITEQLSSQELSLPISPVMTQEETRRVVEVVNKF